MARDELDWLEERSEELIRESISNTSGAGRDVARRVAELIVREEGVGQTAWASLADLEWSGGL